MQRTGIDGQVLWDAEPESASLRDLQRFVEYLNKDLPLLDLGCGNGRQTRFLARHFSYVIGVDVSPSVIQLARIETIDEGNVEYRVLDAVETSQARLLHEEFGDMNVYMRGVFHVIKEPDRPNFIRSLEEILGEMGVLYQIEPSRKARACFETLPRSDLYRLPAWVDSIGFDLKDRELHFPDDRWVVLDQRGDLSISTIPLSHGEEALVPASSLLLRRRIRP